MPNIFPLQSGLLPHLPWTDPTPGPTAFFGLGSTHPPRGSGHERDRRRSFPERARGAAAAHPGACARARRTRLLPRARPPHGGHGGRRLLAQLLRPPRDRSSSASASGGARARGGVLRLDAAPRRAGGARRARPRGPPPRARPYRDRLRRADRKSTRLNSSHLVISYAVFCLKKKKV